MIPDQLRRRGMLAAAFAVMAAARVARAQPNVPEGPIRIIVPYTAGTGPDLMARTVGTRLGERLGRPVVVDNRAGASGSIGGAVVSKAEPNGSTLMFNASTLVSSAPLYANLPYDPVKDFTPISLTGWSRIVLVTYANSGIRTVRDLVEAAKKSPKSINYGSSGAGTPAHLVGELFSGRAGIAMTHVPYRGSAQQLTDILAHQVQMAPLGLMAAAPHVKDGKLIALALTGDKRSSMLPGVPTLAEAGISGVDGDVWYGVFGPPGMSPGLVARLNAEVKTIMQSPEVIQSLADKGFDAEYESAVDFKKRVAQDALKWSTLVKERGIKPE